MGRYLTPGHEYADGQTISGPSLTEHVGDAILNPTAISDQILKDPAALTDEILINDVSTLKKVTIQQLKALILSGSGITPVGGIMDYAGSEAPPGWLFCDGSEISREEPYDVLFGVIGLTYGPGNSISSFNLPDLRGYVTAGKDDMGGTSAGRLSSAGASATTLGGAIGEQTTTLLGGHLAYHQHTVFPHTHGLSMYPVSSEGGGSYGLENGGAFSGRVMVSASAGSTATNAQAGFPSDGYGSNVPHNNIQPTRILNKIIRYL